MQIYNDKSKYSVLIVDDSKLNVHALFHVLREEYNIIAANSGTQALDKAKSEKPDLILLDILLPDIDGYDVLKELKSSQVTVNIPVIFITGLTNPEAESKGLFLGAVDYISKPFNADIVRARVRVQMQISKQMRMIEQLGMIDALTEMANRRRFDQQITIEWSRASRKREPISLLMMDIDNFKAYNDTYGHPAGDALLQTISKTITSRLWRSSDLAARIGGEEFAVLLPSTDLSGAIVVGEGIRTAIEELGIPSGIDPSRPVTISIGAGTAVPVADSAPAELIVSCDRMLYVSKNSGRNKVSYCDEEALDTDKGTCETLLNPVAAPESNSEKTSTLTDILYSKLREKEAKHKEQINLENLLLDIAHSFAIVADIETFINDAMMMTSRHMDIDEVVLAKFDEKEQEFSVQFTSGDEKLKERHHLNLPKHKNEFIYEALRNNGRDSLVYSGIECDASFQSIRETGIKAFMAVPLYVADSFWGVLEFDCYQRAYEWNESDFYLGRFVGNVLSGALARNNAETQLRRMAAIVNSSPEYISFINTEGKFDYINPGAAEITGYSIDELMCGGIQVLYNEQTNRDIQEVILPTLLEKGGLRFELPLIHKNGEERILSLSGFVIDGDEHGIGVIARDVTEQKQIEKQLRITHSLIDGTR